ncbi:Hypothetical protein CINCED_3A014501 [Cinara cedri]|uniref:Aminopeptidase n=1 Tax=Cinara cedri TaxID=506608 RepID=A0A5E4N828_9HEMI|nr:Hypothetical protein CINCED_3A014501 [Cinara cedri]
MLKFVVSIILCALAARDSFGDQDFRLPSNTAPISYDLQFYPIFNGANSTFTGVAKITFKAFTSDKIIVLNQKDLTVNTVLVTDITTQKNQTISQTINKPDYEQYEIYLNSAYIKGRNYLLTITYGGQIRNDLTGLYMSSYKEGNQTKWLAVTQFEGPYARRAFPCYDEPSFKSYFNITVVKPKNMIALSNMPIRKTEPGPTNTTEVVYFEQTSLMATYLAAIFVGEFLPSKNGSDLTVYTHKDYIDQTQYITEIAPKHLHALEQYTGIPYMLPKMDLLAIPDFYFGAMENWGMNTYRESYLLLNDDAKTKNKMRATLVVQHEFTHQWFGDLVTCSWWDYTWLNEGFAAYFQYFATKMVNPNWRLDELFVIDQHQKALAYDQTPRHPITTSVSTTDDISDVFDTITYNKAASVLRMLKYLVNENIFRASLQSYLNINKEMSVSPEDLFVAFDSTLADNSTEFGNDLTVYEFMTNWTTQSGYPVLNIVKNQTSFSIVQSPFFVNAADGVNKSGAWHVGLTFTTELSKNFNYFSPSAWTNKLSSTTVIPAPRNLTGWYIFNIQSTGFYRVNYDADNWDSLTRQLNNNPADIHVLNRAQLIDDSFALAKAGQLNYSVALSLSNYLKNETDAIPWYSAMNSLSYLLERMPRSQDGYGNFKTHISTLAGIIYKRFRGLVSQGNTEFHVLSFWDTFATWACSLDDVDCTADMLNYFNKWQTGEKIPADIKDAAFCVGVKNSNDSSVFDKMFDVFTTTKTISEKFSAQAALACSTNKTQLNQYLYHIFDGPNGPIKLSDFDSVVTAVSKTPIGLDVLYEFLSTNLNKILNEVLDGENIVTFIYSTLAEKVTSDGQIEKIKYLKDNTTIPASVKKSFDKSYKQVNQNLVWFNAFSPEISQWSFVNKDAPTTVSPAPTTPPTSPASTAHPAPSTPPATTIKPKRSSATSNTHSSLIILLLTVFTVLFIKYTT